MSVWFKPRTQTWRTWITSHESFTTLIAESGSLWSTVSVQIRTSDESGNTDASSWYRFQKVTWAIQELLHPAGLSATNERSPSPHSQHVFRLWHMFSLFIANYIKEIFNSNEDIKYKIQWLKLYSCKKVIKSESVESPRFPVGGLKVQQGSVFSDTASVVWKRVPHPPSAVWTWHNKSDCSQSKISKAVKYMKRNKEQNPEDPVEGNSCSSCSFWRIIWGFRVGLRTFPVVPEAADVCCCYMKTLKWSWSCSEFRDRTIQRTQVMSREHDRSEEDGLNVAPALMRFKVCVPETISGGLCVCKHDKTTETSFMKRVSQQ